MIKGQVSLFVVLGLFVLAISLSVLVFISSDKTTRSQDLDREKWTEKLKNVETDKAIQFFEETKQEQSAKLTTTVSKALETELEIVKEFDLNEDNIPKYLENSICQGVKKQIRLKNILKFESSECEVFLNENAVRVNIHARFEVRPYNEDIIIRKEIEQKTNIKDYLEKKREISQKAKNMPIQDIKTDGVLTVSKYGQNSITLSLKDEDEKITFTVPT